MTTFYPYQWDLNYRNPVVFNEMVYNMLYLANQGVDIVRLDAVPYIWKQLGTNCRNLPQVHTIVRMMRMICEIVCPGVLLLGEVVMAPEKVVPYFGTLEKPECHILYNVTTMASTWHTVATKDVSLLRRQLDILGSLPKEYIFQNYLRCHDDIGWGLDYDFLKNFSIDEVSHKKFLNDFFTGKYPDTFGRGELYNDDPRLGDARLCGTTASLCGIEKYGFEGNVVGVSKASTDTSSKFIGISDLKAQIETMINEHGIMYCGITGQNVTEELAAKYGLPSGVYISNVDIDSPAYYAGLQAGDVISAINGQSILTIQQFSEKLYQCADGEAMYVTAMRQGKDGYSDVAFSVSVQLKQLN